MRAGKAEGGGGVVRESHYCTPSQFHAPRPIQVSQNVLRMVHWPRQENIFGICYLIVEIHEQAWVVQKSTTTYYLTMHDATEYFPRTISRCTGDVFYTEPRNWKGGVDYPLQIFIRRCLPRLSPPPLATSPMSILFRYSWGEILLKRMTEYPPFFSVVTTLVGRGVVIPVELLLSVVKFTSAMKKGIAQEVN